jgi:hypothetical protein
LDISKTRLHRPGFALVAAITVLVASCFAKDLKPAQTFQISFPEQIDPANSSIGITYVGAGQIAVWYTEHQEGQLARRSELREGDPWRLKLQLLNTANSSVQVREWPTRKISSAVEVVSGRVIILTGPVVHCLSADLKEIAQVKLGASSPRQDFAALMSSPVGKAVWVVDSSDTLLLQRIDTQSCKLTLSVRQPHGFSSITANDRMFVGTAGAKLISWSPEKEWQTIFTADECCLSRAEFVSQDVIMAYHEDRQGERKALGVGTKGNVIFEDKLKNGYGDGPIHPSSSGKIAVVTQPETNWPSIPISQLSETIKVKYFVYDLRIMKRIASLEESAAKGILRVAISPDDSEIAVLSGSKLSIYHLAQ